MNVTGLVQAGLSCFLKSSHGDLQAKGIVDRNALMGMAIVAVALQPAIAGTAAEIDKEVDAPLEKLYAHNSPAEKDFPTIAPWILVFPNVYKAMVSFENMQ